MIEANKATVLRFLTAMGAGDAAAAEPCLADDAFTLAKGFGHFAGVRERPTILATIAALKDLVPGGLRPDIKTVTAEGDRVVVEFEGSARTVRGDDYANQYCMVFTLQDGKIKRVDEYFCTILADRVLWPLVRDAG